MLRLAFRLTRSFSIPKLSSIPNTTLDIGNSIGVLAASDQPTLTFMQKISTFGFSNMYNTLDQFSRQLLFTLANDYALGIPMAVIAITFLLRVPYFYSNIRSQVAALKMKEMKPEMEKFKQKSRIAQMTKNMALMRAARQELKQAQKKKGVDNFYAFVGLTQIPLLITWFLSLRYVSTLPQIFPSVTQSFLWMSDISAYDPYFILPLFSAAISSYAIIISPALRSNSVMPLMEPFVKYLKYLPFLSLPITGFFPAILNIYWAGLAVNQLLLMLALNTRFVQKNYVQTKQQERPKIMKAVFVQQKQKPKILMASNFLNSKGSKSEHQIPADVEVIQLLSKRPKKIKKPQKMEQ